MPSTDKYVSVSQHIHQKRMSLRQLSSPAKLFGAIPVTWDVFLPSIRIATLIIGSSLDFSHNYSFNRLRSLTQELTTVIAVSVRSTVTLKHRGGVFCLRSAGFFTDAFGSVGSTQQIHTRRCAPFSRMQFSGVGDK